MKREPLGRLILSGFMVFASLLLDPTQNGAS